MAVRPWFKFYPQDWRGEKSLRMVSLAARGLWIECLSIMHEATPYGHLVVNGRRVGGDALARMVGTSTDEVAALLAELNEAGVFEVTSEGIIFSRRMVRDQQKAAKGRKAVQRRWSDGTKEVAENATENRLPNRSPTTDPNTYIPDTRKGKNQEANASCQKTGPPKGRKRATILPEDWQPSPDLIAFAIGEGLTESEVNRETDRFRNHWKAKSTVKDGRKSDWNATFRNWITSPYGLAAKRRDQRVAGGSNAQGSRRGNGLVGAAVWSEADRRSADPVSG